MNHFIDRVIAIFVYIVKFVALLDQLFDMSKHLANVLNLFGLSDYSVALEIVETIGQAPANLILVALKL